MKTRNSNIPIWLMGLSNLPFGLFNGILVMALPQMLAARHVPEEKIATAITVVVTGAIFVFPLGPLLDVRFSRRWYATMFALVSAVSVALSILFQSHITVVEVAMFVGFASIFLSQNALGGWLASVVAREDEGKLSAWTQIATAGGAGLMSIITEEALRGLPLWASALLLGLLVQLPTLIFLWMPMPLQDRRLASESFSQFWGEVFAVIRRREVLVALVMLVAPTGSFTLTNMIAGLGGDFHASPRFISIVGGAGLSFAGIAGSLLFLPLRRFFSLRPLYLLIGTVGSLFTLSLLLLQRTPATFCIALIGENVFQALAITGAVAIIYETIGRDNPFAATQYSLLFCGLGLPIIYMQFVDGKAYGRHGVAGAFGADGCIGIAACILVGLLLVSLRTLKSPAKEMAIDAA
ncbi:PAT family beta-lactamase induction signal transducer AmpG [Silvibacterium bohemicum]|uniref:PAT family beta-lactamase induction signal transducer AmpG n=1 Tax=Silvibacterium bohemicum TaxID=1577686 RepID=A0A841K1U7_9BACT|nr:MFS transporter [Silvibacterium bohemicum]MBB6145151.1 PAT family beta-lactamase induction signal transducer AmpG [Silvibacterium bohemicum]